MTNPSDSGTMLVDSERARVKPGFVAALAYPLRGARLVYVEHPRLARYWIPPLLITGMALCTAGYAVWSYGPDFIESVWAMPQNAIARFIHGILSWLITGVVFSGALVAVALLGSLVAAPFNEALSEAVECELGTWQQSAPGLRELIRDLRRTLQLEIRKLGAYVGVMVPLAVAAWLLPGLGPALYSVFGFGFTIAYFAIDYVDWPAARRRMPARRRFALLRRHPGAMFGFGLAVWLCLWVPLLNLLFMPAAVAGGTMLFADLEQLPARSGPQSVGD